MKITNISYGIDESFQPRFVVELEIPVEKMQDQWSTFHKKDFYAAIGEQLVNAIMAARQNMKEEL